MMKRLPLLALFFVAALVVLGVHFHSLLHIHEIHDPVNDTPALHNRQSTDQTIRKFLELNQTLLELHNKVKELHAMAKQRGDTAISGNFKRPLTVKSSLSERKYPQQVEPVQPQSSIQLDEDNKDSMHQQHHADVQETNVKSIGTDVTLKPTTKPVSKQKRKALIFTMDSITSYEENSHQGGASGEILIRKSLEEALAHFGVTVDVMHSDDEFNYMRMNGYDFIILDPWTWAAKGWVPKPNLRGFEDHIFILDFFGSRGVKGNSFKINPKKILTAYKSPFNSFLGYYMDEAMTNSVVSSVSERLDQGVIWAKDSKHFHGREKMLLQFARHIKLLSTAPKMMEHKNITWLGHQSREGWFKLLASSKFLIGLGNPLLGPSAVDAVSVGCMFFNPIYNEPMLEAKYVSQHPYIADVFPDSVCSYQENDVASLLKCVDKARNAKIAPKIPDELKKDQYLERVRSIFDL